MNQFTIRVEPCANCTYPKDQHLANGQCPTLGTSVSSFRPIQTKNCICGQPFSSAVHQFSNSELRGHPRFFALLDEIRDLHHRKNSNYATAEDPLSNFKMSEQLGIPPWKGCLVRLSDKWSRVTQLAKGTPDMVGESITDTLKDLATYSLLCIVLYEEENTK